MATDLAASVDTTLRHRVYWQLRLLGELARMHRGDRPIAVGPWHGEVGFEILYWIPMVTWIREATGIARDRFHVISRGGVASWYASIAAQYSETFDHWSSDSFRERNAARKLRTGREKQDHVSEHEPSLLAELGLASAHWFHPRFLYNVFAPFWRGQAAYASIGKYLRFRPLTPPPLPSHIQLPDDFVAVKFYFNASFPDTPRNRQFAGDVVSRIARRHPVVLLATGFRVDDHEQLSVGASNVTSLAELLKPRDNLEVQTAIMARARACFGTYGGFSYVPAFLGVPSYSFYSEPDKFNLRHLDVMNAAAIELRAAYSATHVEAYQQLTDAI